MIKKIVLSFFLLTNLLYADLLNDKIKNILGEEQYIINQNLINVLFKKQHLYYKSASSLNIANIVNQLKDNGLLSLTLPKPQYIDVRFHTKSNPIKSMKIINDVFKDLGFYHFYTSKITTNQQDQLVWNIRLNTQNLVDPATIINYLNEINCQVTDILVDKEKVWNYQINLDQAMIKGSIEVVGSEEITLTKPLKPYFLNITKGNSLIIRSKLSDHWYAHIVFYNSNLEILEILKNDKVTKKLKVTIPKSTKYIKITDLYHLNNIKRGLNVLIN